MNSLIFYGSLLLVALMLMSLIPGIKHFTKPIIESLWGVIHLGGANAAAWFVWFVKTLLRAHVDVVRHLLLPVDVLDPTRRFRK